MSQQADDWWNRLYEGDPPDAPASAGESLDDRFQSASEALAPDAARTTPEGPQDGSCETPPGPRGGAVPRTPTVADLPLRRPWEPPVAPGPAASSPARLPAPQAPPEGSPEPPESQALPADPAGAVGALPMRRRTPRPPDATDPRVAERAAEQDGERAPHTTASRETAARKAPPARSAAGTEPQSDGVNAADRPGVRHVGDRPPTYEEEPVALPPAEPDAVGDLVPDTVLDGARYGSYTLRAASVRGDSARYRGQPRRDRMLIARFGAGEDAFVLVAVATGTRAAGAAQLAGADACRWIAGAVGRSRVRLAEDIRAGRQADLKSGLNRLTGRGLGRLRARAAELGLEGDEYTAALRCLLLPADPRCRTRVFFGVGAGGLFRLRAGSWQDLEPLPPAGAAGVSLPEPEQVEGAAGGPAEEPFRFRATMARPGDTLLLCSEGLAAPFRGEPLLPQALAGAWGSPGGPPGLAAFLADTQMRVKGYADDRSAAAVWEA